MGRWFYQDQDWTGAMPAGVGGATKISSSFWHSPESNRGVERGAIDTNYAYDDGSVERFQDVEWDEGDATQAPGGARLIWVPQRGNGYNTNSTWQLNLPKR